MDSGSDVASEHRPLNVPAAAVEGKPGSLLVGAFSAEDLVDRLLSHVGPNAYRPPTGFRR